MTFSGIYPIVDTAVSPEPLRLLDAVLAAGARLVQYRGKSGIDRALLRAMLERTRRSGAKLVVNDDFEAAFEADGWHAGQEDLAAFEVGALRQRLAGRIFGISAAVPDEARDAERAGADYVGVGPFATTVSKDDAGAAIGERGVADVVRATRLPVVAIGGIDLANLAAVARSGAAMAAVITAIARASDPQAETRALIGRWAALHP